MRSTFVSQSVAMSGPEEINDVDVQMERTGSATGQL
jgi:hypothetical protein